MWCDTAALMFPIAQSPMSAVAEEIVSEGLKQLFGLLATWSAGFVTGAQMANFTSLMTARHQLLHQAGWDVERHGLFGAPPIEVVVSNESHRTIFTALRMLGLGGERVRRVDTDAHGRMRPDRLDEILRRESAPCIVCAQIGNVNTGAADAIEQIGSLARDAEPGSMSTEPSGCGRQPVSRGVTWLLALDGPLRLPPMGTSGSTCPTTPASS
jgi:glutamate/tyrosine decarboxylase-like PLP-dependent enzyme